MPTEALATEAASPTQGVYGEPGDLIIELRDENNQPVGNSCFELVDASGNVAFQTCDATDPTPNNGRLGFYTTPSGTYTLRESTVPDGTQKIPDREVTVVAGQETAETLTTSTQAGEPTPTVTSEATASPAETPEVAPTESASPTEGPTEIVSPTEGPTLATSGDNGAVTVDVRSVAQGGTPICVELNTSGGIGFANPPTACDNGDGDGNSTAGIIVLNDIAPGEYVVSITQGPEAALNLPPLDVTVETGQVADIVFGTAAELTVTATLEPTATATAEPTATATPTEEPTATATPTRANRHGHDHSNRGAHRDGHGYSHGRANRHRDGYDHSDGKPTATATTEPTATPTEIPTGSIKATLKDAGGQAINGACIAVDGGNAICDNTANDRDNTAGSIQVDDVTAGDHAVSVTDFPATFLQPDPQQATVVANQTVTVPFVLQAAPVQTGGAVITFTIDGAPLPLGSACSSRTPTVAFPTGPSATGGTDTDIAAGTITLQDVPVGTYAVKLTAESQAKIDGFKSATTGTLIIPANGSDDVTIAIVAEPAPTSGTVRSRPATTPRIRYSGQPATNCVRSPVARRSPCATTTAVVSTKTAPRA